MGSRSPEQVGLSQCASSSGLTRSVDQRMRKSHILVYNLQGIATEIVKNIVLSGVGTLAIVDDKNVSEEDLSSGFFFREEEVGILVSLPPEPFDSR